MTDGIRSRADLGVGVRTLLAAGYTISESSNQPRHVEIQCSRETALGAQFKLLLALSDQDMLDEEEITGLRREATRTQRSLVVVTGRASDASISWDEFYRALGGEVPQWRALAPEYGAALCAAANMELPPGTAGEAWFIFELLVKDGLEFVLGRRVRHLGGTRRGTRVADLLAQLPDGRLIVIDAKATGDEFDARLPLMRPLGEYVQRQVGRQVGSDPVYSALVVSSRFRQQPESLLDTALEFRAQFGVPVAFLEAEVLSGIVERLSAEPRLRSALRWADLLRGGLLTLDKFRDDAEAALAERVTRGDG